MKRILLDTHALIWWINGDQALGEFDLECIASENNRFMLVPPRSGRCR